MPQRLHLTRALLILIILVLFSKAAISAASTADGTGYQTLLYCININNDYRIIENSTTKYSSTINGSIKIKLYIYSNDTVILKIIDKDVTIKRNGLEQKLEAYLSEKPSEILYPSDLSKTISMQKGPYFTVSLVLLNSTVGSEGNETRPVYPEYSLLMRLYIPIQSPNSFIEGVGSLFNQLKERKASGSIGHIAIDMRYGDASLKILRTNDTVGYTVESSFHNEVAGISYNGEETVIYSPRGWLVKDTFSATMVSSHGSRQDESKNSVTIVLCNSTVPGVSPQTSNPSSPQNEASTGETIPGDKTTIGLVFGGIVLAAIGIWLLKRKF